jgi:hypothetical protein
MRPRARRSWQARNLTRHFVGAHARASSSRQANRSSGRRRQSRFGGRPSGRRRRRERLGQVGPRAHAGANRATDVRRCDPSQGKTPIPRKAKRSLAYASQVQLVLQDPFASMNPVHKMRHNLVRPLVDSRREATGRGSARRGRADARVARAAQSFPRPVPARTLRWTVPARLHCPRALHRASGPARRRADIHVGRLGSPGCPQPPARTL